MSLGKRFRAHAPSGKGLALNSSAVAAVVFKSNSDADSEVPGVNSMSGRQLRSNKNVR